MTPTPDPNGDPMSCLSATEEALLELINAERIDRGLQPLVPSAKLTIAAYKHSYDMGQRNYYHTLTMEPLPDGQSGPTHQHRITDAGYTGWTIATENLASGHSTAQAVFDAWLATNPHNANMLDPNITQIGIGLVHAPLSQYRYLWTVEFADGSDGPPPC